MSIGANNTDAYLVCCHGNPPCRMPGLCRSYRLVKAWNTAAALTTVVWRGNRRSIRNVCTSASRSAQHGYTYHTPTVSHGVTSAVVGTYGRGDGRIALTHC